MNLVFYTEDALLILRRASMSEVYIEISKEEDNA